MRRSLAILSAAFLMIQSLVALGSDPSASRTHSLKKLAQTAMAPSSSIRDLDCTAGLAGPFTCSGVDLVSFTPVAAFAGSPAPLGAELSDIWGWTDSQNGDEYVIVGKTNGAAIFRITDPSNPLFLGSVPNLSVQLIWFDIKVYNDHAYIVSESQGHGMQVLDLRRLRGVTQPQTWTPDFKYPLSFAAHNIAINEETGFAYLVGGNVGLYGPDSCMSGLHMIDLKGAVPTFAGCYSGDGYVHDTQCVIYRGPDEEHVGKEICVNSSETEVTVVDVTNKLAPVRLSRTTYSQVGYTHQGWLTEDQTHFLVGDEADESNSKVPTRTMIVNVTNLDKPWVVGRHEAAVASIDHNMYVKDGLVYQANYTSGLRVLDLARVDEGKLTEVAFFDTYPQGDGRAFLGAWSNYPFFESGIIAVSSINEGLFLVRLAA